MMNVGHSLGSGQVFLWSRMEPYWYVIDGQNVLRTDDAGHVVQYSGDTGFFRMDDDMDAILNDICRDDVVRDAVSRWRGLRILRQDPFQCMITFIASANSSIPRIRTCLQRLARMLGETVEFDGYEFDLFPTPGDVARASVRDIERCGFGYRSKYVVESARMVHDGALDLYSMRGMPYGDIMDVLRRVPGVGGKVADCMMLFSLDVMEAFPLDRWMIRILQERYGWFGNDMTSMSGKRYGVIHDMVVDHFGPYAGYAQQFLFKDGRSGGKPLKW